ncbi:type I restriction-modification system subunit M [Limosilactobacillus reuteri]|uniref:class I SAM-dependent DNA methyltransferase n=1 Tax=Limosilactobacillus reuteri TaxID=1598 RepID=UPI001E4FBFFC|nr:N-6 DNA methylase [Limosilactobacillus reuteri]MCC4435507.1 type I restriction-modification system subunit M [Limosilactobacillus reuteri]MCC4438643.1 type I restriction-modification system subunit M [Limosilactobacillus reuteri]MCC4442764.1 type I restriction-modification system subunit M [Limosilactobacillus reuteri]MCC4444618.1 type I restriction-modification system subunit M [Limosilactobacillus reuteri]MCC4446717.1 type I restriction-modification system subunit M [Limosilactobacillus r
MSNQEIVQQLWKECDILRDDGVTYQDYVTELTYILFLKMSKEQDEEREIPEKYRWDNLLRYEGLDLMNFYRQLLLDLGNPQKTKSTRINAIYDNASTSIDEPANLEKIIHDIDGLDWFSARQEGLGALYEGLLEKNANETKSGAGQYFTPRPLINMMVRITKPQIGERLNDPAAGTFGFMVAANDYLSDQTDEFFDLSQADRKFEKEGAFSGMELVPNTHRLALMNQYLHGMDGRLDQGDSLSAAGKWMKNFDVILTNPPFGTKKGGERATRDDLTYETSNKQLNFLQIIYNSLKKNGKARAAVVVPDNVLFADGAGEEIRKDLLNKCNVHTILRLPTGIFYAQGVQTNVLFFNRGIDDSDNTKETWIYDMRHQMRSFGKRSPLNEKDFAEFEKLFSVDDLSKREETWSKDENPNGRWRKFTIDEIEKRPNTSLDITWMSEEEDHDERSLQEILSEMNNKSMAISEAIAELNKALEGIDDED